ncbi:MAG: hypothetical protein H6567_12125 [Lewinellaceae bacterium]|nr:hypothetical protein [Lewinellaceae bacterium]
MYKNVCFPHMIEVKLPFKLTIIGVLFSLSMFGQRGDTWITLSKVTFTSTFNPEFMIETRQPKLSEAVESLNGEEIELDGYIIPLTGQISQSTFMFSRYPQATCFFCGKAGPESAMQVLMKDGKKVKITERKVKLKGRLLISPQAESGLLYTLDNAEITE